MAPPDSIIDIHELPGLVDTWKDLVPGYPRLAGQIGRMPQLGVFRRFGALNARNLLYYQAELAYLEQDLILTEIDDASKAEDVRADFCGNWLDLSGCSLTGDQKHGEQWELVLRMRKLLKKYNKALLQQELLVSMKEPNHHDLDHIQRYMETEEMGPQALTGVDRHIWGSMNTQAQHAADLVTLQPPQHEDAFSRWFTNSAIRNFFFKSWCYRQRKTSAKLGVLSYKESTLLSITYFLTSILASMFPIASITILWVVTSPGARLGIIAAFNLVLSICLAGFTKAKRVEIFAVTSAFAAVQVVFVGSTVPNRPWDYGNTNSTSGRSH